MKKKARIYTAGVILFFISIAMILKAAFVTVNVAGDFNGEQKSNILPEPFRDLPCVYINTEEPIVSKSDYVKGNISIAASESCYYGSNLIQVPIMIRGRGNTTWDWPKKPYRIKFEEKVSVLGLPPAKDWVLLANYSDKSLIRNYVALSLANKMNHMGFNPSSYPVDVFLNGDYIGVYSLGEQVEVDSQRVHLKEGITVADCSFLLEMGGSDKDEGYTYNVNYFATRLTSPVAVKYPDKEELTPDQFKFIVKYVQDVEQAIIDNANYEELIDINSLIDWFIVQELTYNSDAGFRRSCFLHKEAGGKLKMGPVWDFDIAFGNVKGYKDKNYTKWCTTNNDYSEITWAGYLIHYKEFQQKLKTRWNDMKNIIYDTCMNAILESYGNIYKSQIENFKVWDILNIKVGFNPPAVVEANTFDKQIDYLRHFIKNRFEWMDNEINKF